MNAFIRISSLTVLVCLVFFLTQTAEDTPEAPSQPEEKNIKILSYSAPSFRGTFQNPAPAELPEKLFLETTDISESSSHLVNLLNHPETDPTHDVKLLKDVFMHYRTVFKNNPIGVHQEMMRELTGDNPQGIVYVPKNHPAFANGQLHDRWGTPFYFHQISDNIMEVRSAGPDKRHWNSDDVVTR